MSDPARPAAQKELEKAILDTRAELLAVKHTLGTLISWMAQSANSPIRLDEAETLLKGLK